MTKALPPIGKVMNWLEASGFTVSYLYDDLVFIESNAFLIRFDHSDPPGIVIHINTECKAKEAVALMEALLQEAKKHEIDPVAGKKFTLSQKNEEEIDIRFED